MPSASLGTQYGQYGAYYALNVVGVLPGCSFFCDLEEVADSCTAQDVIDYANAWYDAVYAAGLVPGLYVGWGIKLTSEQLYNDLKFASFWSAYNNDTPVATRGFQLNQHTQQVIGGLTVDPNTTQNDEKGDSLVWMIPI
jgi:hypothetical protein